MGFVILGGGISGLTAAFYLRQYGYKSSIKILEASNRLGGWINSYVNENGTLFELGPRQLRCGGNAASNSLQLAETLGLQEKVIPILTGHPSTYKRMIQMDGKMHNLPTGLKSLFTRLSPFSKPLFLYLLKDLRTKKVPGTDESMFSFFERRVGSEIASYIIDPMARGVFAGDAKCLSVLAIARTFYEAEQNYGSIIRGLYKAPGTPIDPDVSKSALANKAHKEKWSVWSLEGGLETLVTTLSKQLEEYDIEIVTNKTVRNISFKDREVTVATDSESFKADHVISCLPFHQLKDIISSIDVNASQILSSIPYVTVALVNLEFNEAVTKEPAFGYLVPSSEPSKLLGVIFDSCTFPQENKSVLTAMMGGHWFEKYFGDDVSKDTFYQIALDEVKKHLDISIDPSSYKVSILKKCIPQYTVGHFDRIKEMQGLITASNYPLHVAGNCINGVGVNDAIYCSKNIVNSILSNS